MSTTAIILAAGKSTRMKSARPKPLHEVCGKPMLHYVLQACYDAGCTRVVVVVGHGKEEVVAAFGHDSRITWVEQTEQLGTGHAARMCSRELEKSPGDVFILAGDGPLIRGQVLQTLLNAHQEEKAAASMATAVLDDPTGYGRIIRDGDGEFVEIVEQGDGTPEQLAIREVFPSYYCVKTAELMHALSLLKNENSKREYYLTDIYAILRSEGKRVTAVQAVTAEDVLSVNTRSQQAEVDAIMQERIQRGLREAGVTIVSPINTYIEADVTIGQDTVIQPFSVIGSDTSIGRNCIIGPFACVPRSSVVREGTTVAGNVSSSGTGVAGS
ncbi:MAG TPA: NTP transferase domain-containing protein [Tepidisphaeraceae bacterium]|jgi:bifunctional UDP-N-acetylglucosamine pyrophosphorylase/glucosamine-1-phosphate N-acetyltransferase|nr:NTP transferase domain-containing protein [Tepidisphaeraceae bacterium]